MPNPAQDASNYVTAGHYGGGGVAGQAGFQPTFANPNSLDPLSYGGYNAGAADATQRYTGLADAIANKYQQQGATQQYRNQAIAGQMYGDASQLGGRLGASAAGLGGALGTSATNLGNALGNRAYGAAGAEGARAQYGAGIYGGAAEGSRVAAADALGQLRSAALGQQPSAAEIQEKRGVSDAMHAQLAAAAGARGGAYAQAAAQQQAVSAGADIQSRGVADAASIRANEMAQARGAYSGAANQLYGTAGQLGLGYEQIGDQSMNQLITAGGQQRLSAEQIAASSRLGALQTGQAGELGALEAGQRSALGFDTLGLEAGKSYDTLGLQGQQAYEGMAADVSRQQLGSNVQVYGAELGQSLGEQQLSAQQTSAAIGAGGEALSAGLLLAGGLSDERLKIDVAPQGSSDLPSPTGADEIIRQDPYGPDPGPAGLSRGQILGVFGKLRGAAQQLARPPTVSPAPSPQMQPLPPAVPAPVIGAAGNPISGSALGGPVMSDERTKTRVTPAPVADALLNQLDKSKSTFAYKNPADQPVSPLHPKLPAARFGGVMAQDLERTPEIGRQLVTDTPRGKQIEPQAGLSAALMAIGRLEERLRAVEGRKGKAA
jgi:hypothetical protein